MHPPYLPFNYFIMIFKDIFRFFSSYNQDYVETYYVVTDELLICQSARIIDLHYYSWLTEAQIQGFMHARLTLCQLSYVPLKEQRLYALFL